MTNYFFSLPANRAQLWFILESDRLRNPVLREFYSEREVVMEERRLRTETQPFGMLYEEFLQAAFRAHPYGRPVVGLASEIQAVSRRSALEYFRRFCGPNKQIAYAVDGLPADWFDVYLRGIQAVTPEQVRQVSERYLKPDGLVIVVVGKPAAFDRPLAELGTVTMMPVDSIRR